MPTNTLSPRNTNPNGMSAKTALAVLRGTRMNALREFDNQALFQERIARTVGADALRQTQADLKTARERLVSALDYADAALQVFYATKKSALKAKDALASGEGVTLSKKRGFSPAEAAAPAALPSVTDEGDDGSDDYTPSP